MEYVLSIVHSKEVKIVQEMDRLYTLITTRKFETDAPEDQQAGQLGAEIQDLEVQVANYQTERLKYSDINKRLIISKISSGAVEILTQENEYIAQLETLKIEVNSIEEKIRSLTSIKSKLNKQKQATVNLPHKWLRVLEAASVGYSLIPNFSYQFMSHVAGYGTAPLLLGASVMNPYLGSWIPLLPALTFAYKTCKTLYQASDHFENQREQASSLNYSLNDS